MKLDNTKYPVYKHQQLTGERLNRYRKNLIVDTVFFLITAPIFLGLFLYSGMEISDNLLVNLLLIMGIPSILLVTYRLARGETFWQLKKQERQAKKR
jgi:hypothetical protein